MELIIKKYSEIIISVIAVIMCLGILVTLSEDLKSATGQHLEKIKGGTEENFLIYDSVE